MNIFQKIAFISKINKAVKELKKIKETNEDVWQQIAIEIDKIIKAFEAIKNLLPALKEVIEAIINIFKSVIPKKKEEKK